MEIKKTMSINNQEIDYYIQYKKIKNIYLRVVEGKIKITCSKQCPNRIIEDLITTRYVHIQKQIAHYQPDYDYRDGGFVYFLGKLYTIILKDMQVKKVVIKNDSFIVYHKNIELVMETYLRDYLLRYIVNKIEYYVSLEPRFPLPEVELKRTKRRYGACFYKRNKVSFNPILVHKPKMFIDYVIVHELCHFLQPNHSPAFYQEIEKIIPNYKVIKKEGDYNED